VAGLRENGLSTPHPSRLASDDPGYGACLAAHRKAVDAGADTYLDPATGFVVMTAPLLARRACCESRCRHCPWIADIDGDPSSSPGE